LHETVERLANAGIQSVPFRTGMNRPDEGDYLSLMRSNAERLSSLLTD